MGSGGGVSKALSNPLGELANFAVNGSTLGLLGYDSSTGKIQQGVATHAADEGLGSVTGRNLARDQAAAADARIKSEDASKQADILAQQKKDAQDDLQASLQARGARRTAASQLTGSSGSQDYSPAQDFLGL